MTDHQDLRKLLIEARDKLVEASSPYIPSCAEDEQWCKWRDDLVSRIDAAPADQWRRVEDGLPPKDGTKFLAFCDGLGEIEISEWFESSEHDHFELINESGLYRKTRVKTGMWNSNHFTHWMPIPALPEDK